MKHQYLRNVATLQLSEETCIGCGLCVQVCPHEVLSMGSGKAHISDLDWCMECGACAMNCPVSALTVRAGVGCAYAIWMGKLTGTEPNCGSLDDEGGCC